MTLPSNEDIKKRQQKLDKLTKSLNPDGSMPENKICTQLRSAVRQVWKMHDVKVSYLMSKSYPDTNPNTRTKWLVDCECCGLPFKTSDVQIDHIKGEHQLKTLDDLLCFAKSILMVNYEGLQVVCVPCHEAITYSERYGMSLDNAFKEKKVIAKTNQTVAQQKVELKKLGYSTSDITNDEKRRDCYRELLAKGLI
ncbi:homing endonuclease HNH [Shewanella sp. phage 1/40]|uniref:HNH endonuclease n=1 Tax=Shewanella phage 1/4 TaxID=1458859 RepID=UPI0004F728D0|nr:HNH endonuclease [Shewanella sp. phage 1/4]YP_009104044.1 HNH endonuclease [Shewanella sp. phage 1/40]AHK11158.1 homing endonuclease HNH [Shewanella sp. phage 1/4]AHK11453.1 homing endonuclease HNH [Shewanella sp. phage 1/40]